MLKPKNRENNRIFLGLSVFFIFAYIVFLIFFNLSSFTGLHRDEAWFGLKAIDISKNGISSLHGMRYYTSSIYSIIIGLALKFGGLKVTSIRLVSAISNLVGICITVVNSYKYSGKKGLFIFFTLLFSYTSFFLFSRIAWEVCSFNFLLISLQVHIICNLIYDKKISFWKLLLFYFTVWFGFLNHIIFVSNIISLLCAIFILTFFLNGRDDTLDQLTCIALLSLGMCIYLLVIKICLSDTFIQNNFLLVTSLFLFPILSCTIISSSQVRHHPFFHSSYIRDNIFKKIKYSAFKKFILIFSIILFIPIVYIFLERHIWGFLGALTGALPLQRILVHRLSMWELATSHLCWLSIFTVLFYSFYKNVLIYKSKMSDQQIHFIWYLYPLCSLLSLSIFTTSTASRHYLISSSLLLCCIPLVAKEIFSVMQRLLLIFVAIIISVHIFASHTLLIHALITDIQEIPFAVEYKSFNDYSRHFYKLDKLREYLKSQQVCRYENMDEFIQEPLMFLFAVDPYHCDSKKISYISYCANCESPVKYFSVKIYQ